MAANSKSNDKIFAGKVEIECNCYIIFNNALFLFSHIF